MKFKATVNVRLRGSVSDAAGNAVMNNTHRVAEGLKSNLLRIGKVIDYWFEADDYETAEKELFKLSETPYQLHSAAPTLGQNNHEIYVEGLGYSPNEYCQLRQLNII